MLRGILRFEWRYHTRRLTFAAAALALAAMAVVMISTGYGPPGVDMNAPYTVMQSLGLLSLMSVFVLTIFCANAALRDAEHGMTEIIFATPVGKPRYLLGRFGGAVLAALSVMAAAALVLMLAPLVLAVEPERLGPVRPLAYAWALLLLVLPNLVLVGALLFAVATLTRSTLATYVAAVAIYALYLVTALLIDSPLMAGTAPPTPEALARAAVLDPFGLSAFFEQTRYWTPAERDVRRVALAGRMLVNRALWLGVSAAVLALAYWRFSFSVDAGKRSGVRTSRAEVPPSAATYRPAPPAVPGPRTLWLALRSAARLELRHVLRGWTFLALLALWVFVVGMEAVAELASGEYGTRVLPTTGLMLDTIQLPLLLLGTITIVYYAAEVAWRERIVGFDPLVDATPASSAVFYLSKAAALCALPTIMAALAIVVGMVVQLAHGQSDAEPALYLTLFWFAGVPLALFALGALAVQALSPNRWIGMLGGLLLALVARRGEMLGLEHPMLRFGFAPPTPHSEMDGFGPAARTFAAFMLYWGAAAALLACVSWGVWRRGVDERGALARLASLPRSWGRPGTRFAVACAALFVAVGAGLYWQTNVAHAWEGSDARETWRADYEHAYRRLHGRPQPSVVAVRTAVDYFPSERRAEIAGSYVLENRTGRPIDTLWAVVPRDVALAELTVAGTRLVRHDARFGVHVLAFASPLPPGGRAELGFRISVDRGGVRAAGLDYDVTGNGSFLTSGDAFPTFGYHPSYELGDPRARREHGLAAAPTGPLPLPATDSARAAVHRAGPEPAWLTLDVTLSTSNDQTALGPGRLVRSWEAGGRRYFHYLMDRPVTPRFGLLSARYAVRRVRHGGVDVEVWHDPRHAANVQRILDAATRTLDLLGARYGAYPHDVLRIAEVPAWSNFGAFALPGMVFFPESRGFLSDPRDSEVDLVTRRVAHEVAHQWWGHRLDPADVPGGTTLVETLAKHSEQIVVESMHGAGALPPMLAFDEDRYLAGSAQEPDSEPTLLETRGQAYLYYGKGAVAMHALRDLLGAASVDRALARLISEYGGPAGAATSLDLRDLLLAEAAAARDSALVDEWLGDRVVYDLRVDSAAAAPLAGGRFRLTTRIGVAKLARRSAGEEPRSADGEMLDVAVWVGDALSGQLLHDAKHPVAEGRIDLVLDLPARPERVVVDPYVRRIDRDRTNNQRRVTAAPASP